MSFRKAEAKMTPFDSLSILAFIIRFDFKFNHRRDVKEQCNNILKIIKGNQIIAEKVGQTVEELMKDDRPH